MYEIEAEIRGQPPDRIIVVRANMHLGQTVRFLDYRDGQMRGGKVVALKVTQVTLHEDGHRLIMPCRRPFLGRMTDIDPLVFHGRGTEQQGRRNGTTLFVMSPLEGDAAAGGVGSAARASPDNDRYATVILAIGYPIGVVMDRSRR